MRPRLRYDDEGSAELPLQLVIAVLVLSIALGIIYEGMQGYSRAQTETAARSLAQDIDSTARQVSRGGNMTTLFVRARLDPSRVEKLEWFRIGVGDKGDGIFYMVEGEREVRRYVGIPFMKLVDGLYERAPLELGKGSYLLYMRNIQDPSHDPPMSIAVWAVGTGG